MHSSLGMLLQGSHHGGLQARSTRSHRPVQQQLVYHGCLAASPQAPCRLAQQCASVALPAPPAALAGDEGQHPPAALSETTQCRQQQEQQQEQYHASPGNGSGEAVGLNHSLDDDQADTMAVSINRLKSPDYSLVSNETELLAMLEDLRAVKVIALDCEGVKLGERQNSKLTLMQLSARISQGGRSSLRIWIVDILQLEWRAFHYHTADKAVSLKGLLEDDSVAKLMYDVRSDTTQLQQEYNIKLRAAYDLQLAEVAVRQLQMLPTSYVLPLDKALSNYLPHSSTFLEDMQHSYDTARAYHYSNRTEVWEQRPLTASLLHYAATDVRYLHALQDALHQKLPGVIIDKVKQASNSRAQQLSAPDKRRAEAPVIVRRGDIMKLINSNNGRPHPPPDSTTGSSASTDASNSNNGSTAHGLQQGADGAAHNAGDNPGSGRRRRPKGKEAPVAAEPEKLVHRALPQKLPVQLVPGAVPHSSTGKGVSQQRHESPMLLAPRKREEGEEAPTWIYDSLTVKPAAQQAGHEEEASQDQNGVQQHSDQHHDASVQEEQKASDSKTAKPTSAPPVQRPSVANGMLLWEGDGTKQSQQQQGPTLQRPVLQRPVRRQ